MKLARVLVGVVAFAAACAEAGGEPTGGGLTAAGSQAATPSTFTSPDLVDCSGGTGNKWSDLYRDMFGPTQKPGSCTYSTNCHGPNQEGALSAAGIQCFDETRCRASLLAKNLVSADNAPDPKNANIFGILRHKTAAGSIAGIMPQSPAAVFPDTCLERIQGWIADGVPAN